MPDAARLDSFLRSVDNLEKDWEELIRVSDKAAKDRRSKPLKLPKPKPIDREEEPEDKEAPESKPARRKDDEDDMDIRSRRNLS